MRCLSITQGSMSKAMTTCTFSTALKIKSDKCFQGMHSLWDIISHYQLLSVHIYYSYLGPAGQSMKFTHQDELF